MKILEVAPIGYMRGPAFVTREGGCTLEEIERPVYPPSSRGATLRRLRIVSGLTLRESAAVLGLNPSEVSGLEFGSLDVSAGDWGKLFDAIRAAGAPEES